MIGIPGDYRHSLARLLDAAPKVSFIVDGQTVYPLAHLNVHAAQDLAIGMMSSWAVIEDVLRFYLERIATEGYLAGAAERRSILNLASMTGYRLSRGVSAQTWLALTVADLKGQPESVRIPAGPSIVVQNIPKQGELPVIFETLDELECARCARNSIRATPGSFWKASCPVCAPASRCSW
jgi:hypothetical protein